MVVTVYADTISEYLDILHWLQDNIGHDGWRTDYSMMSTEPGNRDWGNIEIYDEKKALWFQLIWG